MDKKKIILAAQRFCAFLCAAAMAGSLTGPSASADTSELDALRAERSAIEAKKEEKQAEIDALKGQAVSILVQKQALDERNLFTMQQIELNNQEIELYEQMIAEKEAEYRDAMELEEQQLERYRNRVRAMEENGTLNYLAMILQSNNLGEMLTTMDDVGEIMLRDREIENSYIEAKENSAEVKADYEKYKKEIAQRQDELKKEQEMLQKEIDEASELLLGLHEDYEHRQAEIAEIEAQEEETNMAISVLVAKLEAQRAAEQAAAAAAAAAGGDNSGGSQAAVYSAGSFIFPVASYSCISSRFGERIHPITGELKHHNGMDIAANMGTTIYAADGGKVVLAEWYGGYGNCIMIDHGNGYKTLYGHLSVISVSSGQYVTQGDVIGQVGSTGNSTGPHLHFEVYSNGTRIDPEQFYSGLIISQDAGV